MKTFLRVLIVAMLAVPLVGTAAAQEKEAGPLPWAYGGDAPPATPPSPTAQPDPSLKHVAGSNLAFTLAQVRGGNGAAPADWHPEDHGAMPDIVAYGKKPDVLACSLCHLPNGKGRPENAGIAGLPVDYFVKQLMDFKNDLRTSAEPRKGNTKRMASFAKTMTDDEMKAAAEYFGSIPWTPWIKVVETKVVPKTKIESDGLFLKLDGDATEPLGNRIIEVPENTEASSVLRDDHSPFVAYVPIGSIKKGEVLVTTGGGGKTIACGLCHGDNLEGIGPVPPLAGRSTSYIARQLYDIQQGTRKGLWSKLMQKPVQKLTTDDIIAICAYIASRPVPPAKSANSVSMLMPAQGSSRR